MTTRNENSALPREWIVVCVVCGRIKRNAKWTDEVAADTKGKSTGYCDACARRERKT
jgi:hypothetical protein